MDICEDVMPVSDDLSNEMPVEVSNEMPVDLHNEMPVDGLPRTNAENVEDRHVVNGDSYASRAARTVSHEYPSRQERARFSENVMPQRPRTAFFTPSKTTTAKSVFEALENADIDATEIACLQRKMNGEVTVTFKSISAKEKFLRLNSLQVDAEHFALQDVDKPLTLLTIYDAPFELSDLAIIKRLAPYCEVLHYRRGKHSLVPNIYNGLRHYRVRISKPIPSFLRFGKFQVFLKHSGQVPTCRKCNRPSHFSNVCLNRVCFNCEGLGHEARDCPCPVLCCLCKEEGHLGINCIYSWFSPPVSPTNQQDDVAVESDDDDGLSDCSYGRGADYLLSASPLISETPSPAVVPVDDTSSVPDAVLSDSSDSPLLSSPDSPVLNTDGLVKSVQSVPDPPRHRIPALLSDSLSAASRRSSSPLSAKSTPSLPSEPVLDPPSSSPVSLKNGMDVTMDLKRKSADASPKRTKKGKKKPVHK